VSARGLQAQRLGKPGFAQYGNGGGSMLRPPLISGVTPTCEGMEPRLQSAANGGRSEEKLENQRLPAERNETPVW